MNIVPALRHRRFVGIVVFFVLLLGLLTGALCYFFYYRSAPARARPRGPIIAVLTYYKDMPAEAIEKTITDRLERWVNQAPGSRRIESRSIQGVSMIRVYFRDDIDPSEALTTVSSLAMGTLPTLPPNTLPPVTLPVSDDSLPLGLIEVDNPSYDEARLKDLARIDVRNLLGAVPGCVAPIILGGQERTVTLSLDPVKLAARNLATTDVVKALQDANLIHLPGGAYFGENEILLDGPGMVDKIQELNELPIRAEGDHVVRLRDIGQAQDAFAPRTTLVRLNGKRAVCVPVYNQQGSTAKSVRNGIGEELLRIEEKLPKGSQLQWLPLAYPVQWSDDGLITLHVRTPSGSRLDGTEKRIVDVEKVITAQIPAGERAGILCEIGVTPDWEALYTENAGPQDATFRIQLSGDRRHTAEEYAVQLRHALLRSEKLADLQLAFTTAASPAIDIQVQAKADSDRLEHAQEISRLVTEIEGAVDVHTVQRNDAAYLLIQVDRKKAAAVGIAAEKVLFQALAVLKGTLRLNVRTALQSDNPNLIIDCPDPIANERELDRLLGSVTTGTTAADPVKLNSLVTVIRKTSAVEINHINLNPVTTVRLSVEGRRRSSLIGEIKEKLKRLQLPAGVSVDVEE